MGYGGWDSKTYAEYTVETKASTCDSFEFDYDTGTYTVDDSQEIFKETTMNEALNPYKVTRECRDSEEHPATIPVILALDVTGSMGDAAKEVAGKLNAVMTGLYDKIKDVEFLIMGIGDYYCDKHPLQVSQFESDIRIAEQLDKLYFEFGGGSNPYESYSAAWYFADKHTDLDCWKRGKKGIIITMGDEQFNPYIPIKGNHTTIAKSIGDTLQNDIDSKKVYEECSSKYDIYHIDVDHRNGYNARSISKSWLEILDKQHFKRCSINDITNTIVDIVVSSAKENNDITFNYDKENVDSIVNEGGMQEISW